MTHLSLPQQNDMADLQARLNVLDKQKLSLLLRNMAINHPELIAEIQAEAIKLFATVRGTTVAGVAAAPPAAMDLNLIRKQIRLSIKASRSHNEYSDYDSSPWQDLEETASNLLDEARAFFAAGNARLTLPVFEAIAGEILDHDDDFEYTEWGIEDLLTDIAIAWTEAILLADLTDDERGDWADRASALTEAEYITGTGILEMVVTAAEQGWDYPALVRALQGEITEYGAWEPDEEAPDYADELAKARLNVLERQGRIQEAIYLAEAEGETTRFLELLVKGGRAEEAVKAGLEQIATPDEALALAKHLAETKEVEAAFTIAQHGIDLPPPAPRENGFPSYAPSKRPLALWLRDYALLHDRTELAMTSAKLAFMASPTLEDYLLLQKLSGSRWETLREEFLDRCRATSHSFSSGAIDILLHEKEYLAALKQVDNSYSSDAARVAEAALTAHPDEVIALCKKRAEAIMDAGQAKQYDTAQYWLRLVRDAYQAANKGPDWQNYRTSLLDIHGRKYKLVPLIRAL